VFDVSAAGSRARQGLACTIAGTARSEKVKLSKSTLVLRGNISRARQHIVCIGSEPDAKREQVAPMRLEAFTSLNLEATRPEQGPVDSRWPIGSLAQ